MQKKAIFLGTFISFAPKFIWYLMFLLNRILPKVEFYLHLWTNIPMRQKSVLGLNIRRNTNREAKQKPTNPSEMQKKAIFLSIYISFAPKICLVFDVFDEPIPLQSEFYLSQWKKMLPMRQKSVLGLSMRRTTNREDKQKPTKPYEMQKKTIFLVFTSHLLPKFVWYLMFLMNRILPKM